LFWLGGWAFGEISATGALIVGPPQYAKLFLVFWLCAWTVGGVGAMAYLRRIFQTLVPETITLHSQGIVHDPGVPPVDLSTARRIPWSELFPKRTVAAIDRAALQSLRLRDDGAGNRLTVDLGVKRIELAKAATDVEREWIHRELSERYSIVAAR
jgi:hypothetical protein